MLCRQQLLFFEGLMDHRRHVHIPMTSPTRLHMGNQAGRVCITTLGQMHRCHRPTTWSAFVHRWPAHHTGSKSSSLAEGYCHQHGSALGRRLVQIAVPRPARLVSTADTCRNQFISGVLKIASSSAYPSVPIARDHRRALLFPFGEPILFNTMRIPLIPLIRGPRSAATPARLLLAYEARRKAARRHTPRD
jgi:hypothetical protein